MACICYRKGYKYQLYQDFSTIIDIRPQSDIRTSYIALDKNGTLTIKTGYAWDGPSGPTIDTLNFMRGALVHDALYQLMREQQISSNNKVYADNLLRKMCREDGMSGLRAWYVYQGVKRFGKPAINPNNKRPYIGAPKGCSCNPPA